MASDCVNVFAPSQLTSVDRLGPVEVWHRLRPGLWPDDGGRHPDLSVGRLRNDDPRTPLRLVSGWQGQERCQTRPQTAQSGGAPVLCPPARLGGAWTDPTCRHLALAMDASTLGQRFPSCRSVWSSAVRISQCPGTFSQT